MKKTKRLLALSLAMCMLSSVTAFAADDHIANISGGTGTSDVSLTMEVPTFSVTVPTQLPVAISASGEVSCADSGIAKITNSGYAPIYVSNIEIVPGTDWDIIDYDENFDVSRETPNVKKIGFKINDATSKSDETFGNYNESDWAIAGYSDANSHDELGLTYDACLPIQLVNAQETTVAAQVIFTVAWDTFGYFY